MYLCTKIIYIICNMYIYNKGCQRVPTIAGRLTFYLFFYESHIFFKCKKMLIYNIYIYIVYLLWLSPDIIYIMYIVTKMSRRDKLLSFFKRNKNPWKPSHVVRLAVLHHSLVTVVTEFANFIFFPRSYIYYIILFDF